MFFIFVEFVKSNAVLMSTALMSWSRHLCYFGLTIVTRCFMVCQIPPSHHSLLSFTPQPVKNLSPRDHITPSLRQLHWLPIQARIYFKICLLKVMSGSVPPYMSSLVRLHLVLRLNQGEDYA